MKATKTIIIAALVAGSLFAGNLAARADDSTNTPAATQGSEHHHHGGFAHLSERLGLTADQQPKVKAILKDQMTKMRALHTDTSLSRDEKHAKFKALREATDTQLKAILTPDQFTKWQKMMHHRHHPPQN